MPQSLTRFLATLSCERHQTQELMIQCTSLPDTPEITIDRIDHPDDHPHNDPVQEVATGYAISQVECGSFDIQVGRERWTLGPGSIFLCSPGLVHRYHHHEANPVDVCVSVSYRRDGDSLL